MSSLGDYRDSGPEDYLAAGERGRKAAKAGQTGQNAPPISAAIPVSENIRIDDIAVIGPNKQARSENLRIADAVSVTGYASGDFRITEEDGTTPEGNPVKISFSDIGDGE